MPVSPWRSALSAYPLPPRYARPARVVQLAAYES